MQVPDGLVTQVQVRQLLRRRVDQGAGAHFADSDRATDVERKGGPRLALVFAEPGLGIHLDMGRPSLVESPWTTSEG